MIPVSLGLARAKNETSLDQVVAPRDAVEGSRIRPPVLVDVEIRGGGHEQRVVLRCLNIPLTGIQVLPLDQRLEEHIHPPAEPETVEKLRMIKLTEAGDEVE